MPERFFAGGAVLRMAEEIGYSAERLPDVFSQMSVWLAKDAENDRKEEASALAEALLHCADRLEQERSEPLEVVWNAELGAWAAQTVLSREEAKSCFPLQRSRAFQTGNDKDSGCSGCPANSKAGRNLFLKRQRQKKRMVLSVSPGSWSACGCAFLVKTDHLKEGVQGLDGSWTDL